MSDILPPTTSRDLDATQSSPCCGTDLVLTSPPNLYECRDCMTVYDLSDSTQPVESEPSGDKEGDTTSKTESTAESDESATCAGKDGECTRSVDEPGDYCWQHEPSGE